MYQLLLISTIACRNVQHTSLARAKYRFVTVIVIIIATASQTSNDRLINAMRFYYLTRRTRLRC